VVLNDQYATVGDATCSAGCEAEPGSCSSSGTYCSYYNYMDIGRSGSECSAGLSRTYWTHSDDGCRELATANGYLYYYYSRSVSGMRFSYACRMCN
jgi:hypothetical protein